MNRLDGLPEQALVAELAELLRVSEERKAAQRFGSDSVRTTTVSSGQEWDITVAGVEFRNAVVEVSFVPDNPPEPGAGIVFDYGVDAEVLAGPNVSIIGESLLPEGSVQRWRMNLVGINGSPATVRMRFYFSTIGGGTISARLL